MKYLKAIKTNTNEFDLSRIGLGTMRMGQDQQEGIRTIHAALDNGVNFLNTADFYNGGQSEMMIREALKSRKREDIFISVKFGALHSPDGVLYGIDTRPLNVKNYLNYTLKRLGVDYVDLYQPARIDPNIPVEDTIGAIADMVNAGYVRTIGISEVDGDTLRKANATHPISLVEVQYSLLNRGIEDNLLPTARELGVGIVGFGNLLSGLIGGSARQEKLSNLGKRMSAEAAQKLSGNLSLADALQDIADEKGITLAQLATAWVLAQGKDIIALAGSRTVSQWDDTLKALDVTLSNGDLKRIEQIVPKSEATNSYMLKMNLDKNGLFQK